MPVSLLALLLMAVAPAPAEASPGKPALVRPVVDAAVRWSTAPQHVVAVTGDHSTPSQMAAHSWHPVPALLWSNCCGRDDAERFGERWCRHGALGLRPTKDLMAVMLANAGRLQKYGA